MLQNRENSASARAAKYSIAALALGAAVTMTAMGAEYFGWQSALMHWLGMILGGIVMALALTMLHVQNNRRLEAGRALDSAQTRIGMILESAMDAIITMDEAGKVVLFNQTAETIFGCRRDQAIGGPLTRFIPERYRAAHATHVRRFGESGVTSRRMDGQRIVSALRSDGSEFPIEASISCVNEAGQKYYTVILRDVSERVRADAALRRSREELRELGAAASSAREQEKSRIARELHDELAQTLTALKMDLVWARENSPSDRPQLAAKLAAMQSMVEQSVTSTRRISADLRPLVLDDLGLVPAAEWLVGNFIKRTGIGCELRVEPPEFDVAEPHASAVFRMLQEALANAAKHSQATRVDVLLRLAQGTLALEVRDNGRGYDTAAPRKPDSYGIVGLRERAHLINGNINIFSAPDKGTTVAVHIPYAVEPVT